MTFLSWALQTGGFTRACSAGNLLYRKTQDGVERGSLGFCKSVPSLCNNLDRAFISNNLQSIRIRTELQAIGCCVITVNQQLLPWRTIAELLFFWSAIVASRKKRFHFWNPFPLLRCGPTFVHYRISWSSALRSPEGEEQCPKWILSCMEILCWWRRRVKINIHTT